MLVANVIDHPYFVSEHIIATPTLDVSTEKNTSPYYVKLVVHDLTYPRCLGYCLLLSLYINSSFDFWDTVRFQSIHDR